MVTSRNQHNCHNTAISDGLGPSLLGQEHLLLTRWPRERQDGVWSTLIQWKMSLPMAGDGAGWILGSLLTQNILGFCDSMEIYSIWDTQCICTTSQPKGLVPNISLCKWGLCDLVGLFFLEKEQGFGTNV